MAVKYDPNKDYSAAIEAAKKSGASQATINQLTAERNAKIADKYNGKEPTMYGSNQTYKQASSSGNQSAIDKAVSTYNQYSGTTSNTVDPWQQYAGTNFHQDAINAAQGGDWDAVIDFLSQREDKVAAQGGDNRGKTSAEIYAELWSLYGQPEEPTFDFDYESRPTYNDNGMSSKIDAMLNQILNRDKFSYNAAEDDLYKQYASMYQREGTRAMNDAMMSAAATAGGMNSYAMTAANQANNYYMAQLNDKIPELYQLAYDMYLKDIDNQVRDLGLLNDMDDKQYNRYRDTMSDWENDRNFIYGMYQDDVAKGQWEQQFDTTNSHWQQEFDHTVGQDNQAQANRDQEWAYETGQTTGNTAYAKAMELLNAGAMPDAAMLKEAGMTEEQAAAILAQVKLEQGGVITGGSDTGSGGGNDTPAKDKTGGGWYDNRGVDKEDIKKMQRALGVTADGLWGKGTQAAAEKAGWSTDADKAWAAFGGKKPGNPDAVDEMYMRDDLSNATLASAIINLNIGVVNEDTVWEMVEAGGVKESNGKFVWANGWNKDNWQDKLAAVRSSGGIGLYAGINY